MKADCLAELTRERILDLRRVLKNKPDRPDQPGLRPRTAFARAP